MNHLKFFGESDSKIETEKTLTEIVGVLTESVFKQPELSHTKLVVYDFKSILIEKSTSVKIYN